MEAVNEKQRMIEIKAVLQNMEATIEKNRNTTPFNPLPHFKAPQFYTEQELAEIEEISQSYFQVKNKKRATQVMKAVCLAKKRIVKPKPAKKRELKKIVSPPPPKLTIIVESKIKELNGRDIKYVMHKELYVSDLDKEKCCLSLPVELDYLNEIEKTELEKRNEKGKLIGLDVVVLDTCFREFSMSLRKWDMRNDSVYNLVQDCKLVLSKNKFKKNQKLNIWSFRDINEKLYFVLDDKVNSQESEKLNNSDDKTVNSEESEAKSY